MRTTPVPSFAARPETLGLAAELGDYIRGLIDGLFDTYRPELHYMRGPGPKWHAKHDAQNGGAACIDSRCRQVMFVVRFADEVEAFRTASASSASHRSRSATSTR